MDDIFNCIILINDFTVDDAPVHTVIAVSATRLVVALSTKIFTSIYTGQSEAAEPLCSIVPISSIAIVVYVVLLLIINPSL